MSRLRALGATAAVVVCAALTGAVPVAASEGDSDGTVTWSVAPADVDGPDGRRVIDIDVDPGDGRIEHVAVTNHSDQMVSFALAANDGYLTERGSFDMLPSGTPPTKGGAWLEVPDEVTVGPGDTVVVPVQVTVPADAIPGDHPAGVTAALRSAGEVEVEYRVGVRVNLRVTGEVVTSVAAEVLEAFYRPSWNPFAPGEVVLLVEVVNDGSVGIGLAGTATASSRIGGATSGGPPAEVPEILPDGRVEVRMHASGVWPIGPTRATAEIDTVLAEDLTDITSPVTATVTTNLWAVPLPQLILLLALVLAALVIRKMIRQRRARLERLLAQARAEGAARALADT